MHFLRRLNVRIYVHQDLTMTNFYYFLFPISFGGYYACIHLILRDLWDWDINEKYLLATINSTMWMHISFIPPYFHLLFFSFTCAFLNKLNQLWTFVISTCFPFRINCGHILSFQFHHKKVFFYFIFLMMWRLFMLSIHVPDFWSSRFHELLISINHWITNGPNILYISYHLGLLMNYSQT